MGTLSFCSGGAAASQRSCLVFISKWLSSLNMILLSFDSQFCFLPLCLVSSSPIRNLTFVFLGQTLVLSFHSRFRIPSLLSCILCPSSLTGSPCFRLGSAEMHLCTDCVCYKLQMFIHEILLMKPWFWWRLRFLCFGSTGSPDQYSRFRSDYAHRLDIIRSNLAIVLAGLLKPWWWSAWKNQHNHSVLRRLQGKSWLGFGNFWQLPGFPSRDALKGVRLENGPDQWDWMWF